jgi:hypothetical protein
MTVSGYSVQVDFMGDPETIPVDGCFGCGWTGMASECAEIDTCSLTPGDPSPAGRCPECDCLVYIKEAAP